MIVYECLCWVHILLTSAECLHFSLSQPAHVSIPPLSSQTNAGCLFLVPFGFCKHEWGGTFLPRFAFLFLFLGGRVAHARVDCSIPSGGHHETRVNLAPKRHYRLQPLQQTLGKPVLALGGGFLPACCAWLWLEMEGGGRQGGEVKSANVRVRVFFCPRACRPSSPRSPLDSPDTDTLTSQGNEEQREPGQDVENGDVHAARRGRVSERCVTYLGRRQCLAFFFVFRACDSAPAPLARMGLAGIYWACQPARRRGGRGAS